MAINYTGNGTYGVPWSPVTNDILTVSGSSPTVTMYDIQGKMLTYRWSISDVLMQDSPISQDGIKRKMAEGLVEEILKNNCIEFTKMQVPHTGEWIFHARMYVVPDDKVRILRLNSK